MDLKKFPNKEITKAINTFWKNPNVSVVLYSKIDNSFFISFFSFLFPFLCYPAVVYCLSYGGPCPS